MIIARLPCYDLSCYSEALLPMKLSLPAKFALVSFLITLVGVVGMAMMAYHESGHLLQQEATNNLAMGVRQEAALMESQV